MTIKEIARQAGVGVSTVSRYLNDGYVSQEKREVIAKIIKENNYQRNQAAVTMRGKSKEIVIIVQRVSSNTTSRFLEGVIKRCEDYDYKPTIHVVSFSVDLQDQYIKTAIDRNAQGIIIYSFTENIDVNFENILVVGQQSKRFKSIYSSGKKVYRELVSTVVKSNNISKIEVLGIDILDVEFINRVAGAIEAAKLNKIPYKVWEETFSNIHNEFILSKGTYYVALTDSQAYQVIQMANIQNFVVGKDIFISGYGDYGTSSLLGLTTVDGCYEEVGAMAVDAIINRESKSVEINPVINYRNTTGNYM